MSALYVRHSGGGGGGGRTRNERAATLVEFALVLPVFMMLILGMVTGGHAYFRKISITDAVREGTRYGATYPVDLANVTAWENAVRQRVIDSSGGDLEPAEVCVELVQVPDSDATSPCDVPDPAGVTGWHVKVTAQGTAKLEWLVSSTKVTFTGRAVALYEREPS